MPRPQEPLQRQLFDEPRVLLDVRLPSDVQQQLRQALVQWMQALAKKIQKEDNDEPDHC